MESISCNSRPKAAIYCRLSDEDRNKKDPAQDSRSIRTQKAMLCDYAKEKNWEIYKIYSDDDYSGTDSGRPEYNQLLRDAEAGKFDIVLCKHQSRFTRDMVHVETYINQKFKEWGVRYISLLDGADTFLAGNKKSRQINGLVNEWYLEDLSENIRKACITRKKEGKYLASCPVYGYRKDPDNFGHLLVDEPAAQIVRRIFELYISGVSMNMIARILNEEGILTPTEYKTKIQGINFKGTENLRKGKRYKGEHLWQSSSVNRILKNETYTGGLYQNRQRTVSYKNHSRVFLPREEWIIVDGTHEAIISREDFERAKDRGQRNPRIKTNGEGSFFTGKLVCGYCGGAVVSNSRKNDEYRYYRCHCSANLKKCIGVSVSEKLLKEKTLQELKCIVQDLVTEEDMKCIVNQIKISGCAPMENLHGLLFLKKEELEKLTERKAKLYEDMSDGVITADDYRELTVHYARKQDALKRDIEKAERIMEAEQKCSDKQKELKNLTVTEAEKFLRCEELTPAMLEIFVDYIEVENGSARGVKNLKIHWNF